MDRFQPRPGTWAPYASHIAFMNDAADRALRGAFGDYLELAQDFFVHGAVVTETPSGSSTTVAITEGSLFYKGELISVEAHNITQLASQVVYLLLQDDGVDTTPVPNLDGSTDYVLRKRHAVLQVGPVYPTEYMSINAPRKTTLDLLRLKGRVVPTGGILPYYGDMGSFDATGLGQADTPMEGFAVCNGLNGTVDLRGMTPFGATDVPDSGAATPYAGIGDPSSPGDTVGSDRTTIEPDHLPEHTHDYHDRYQGYAVAGATNGSGGWATEDNTRTSQVNDTAHNDLSTKPASFALVFIQSIV